MLSLSQSIVLKLLERDVPDYIFYRRCALLHLPIFELNSQDEWNCFCFVADMYSLASVGLPPQTRFSLLQWTTKRRRMGFNYCEVLKYFLKERTYRRNSVRVMVDTTSKKLESEIEKHSCDFKTQFLLPASHIGPLSDLAMIGICSHLWYREERGLLTLMIDCKLSHQRGKSPCSACDGLRQCHCCYTVLQLNVKGFGKRGWRQLPQPERNLGNVERSLIKWDASDLLSLISNQRSVRTGYCPLRAGNIQESFGDGKSLHI